jgi:hypothetical protein
MATSTIMVIRHAEKPKVNPGEPDLGLGVSEMGEEDKHSLVVRGWQRAGAWAVLFGSGAFGPDYPKPGAVFAANPVAPPKGRRLRQRAALQYDPAIMPAAEYHPGETVWRRRRNTDARGRKGAHGRGADLMGAQENPGRDCSRTGPQRAMERDAI